jgi:hypothetical protein
MGFQFRYMVIDPSEPVLWVAIGAASVAAMLLGRAIGRRAATNGGGRGVALAALDLVVLGPVLLAGEVVLLSLLLAPQTGGEACLPLVRNLLLLPAGAATLAASLAWRSSRQALDV